MRKNIELVFIVMLLICITPVLASTPDFDVDDNLGEELNDHLVNGVNDMGEIVVTYSPYISEIVNASTFASFSVQQYDRLRWQGNESIVITNPFGAEAVLVAGGQYYFNFAGAYDIESLQNSSRRFIVTVLNPSINQVDVEVVDIPSGFEMNFTPSSFILNDERVIDVTIEVDDDISTGDYNFTYKLNNKEFTKTFDVIQNQEWIISEDNLTTEIIAKNGENIHLGYVELQNVGNDDIEISFTKSGDSKHLISVPQSQTLYKKQTVRVDLQLQVPLTQDIGEYEVEIAMKGGLNISTFNFTIEIIDSIDPIIEDINFSSYKAQDETTITLLVDDNTELGNATMTYDGKTLFFKKDNQKYTLVEVFVNTGIYEIEFCVEDTSENEYCEKRNETFSKVAVIDGISKKAKMPSKKVGQYSTVLIFNLTQRVPEGIEISLVDFVSTTDEDISDDTRTIRIIDGDESIERFSDDNSIKVYEEGPIYLEVRSEEVSDFTGTLGIETPAYIEEVSDIVFDVSFKDFDIPEDFTKTWSDFTDLTCTVEDSGDLDTSKYACLFYAPIYTTQEEIAIPTTVEERESFRQEVKDVQAQFDKSKRQSATLITLLIVFVILFGTFTWFMLTQYPYVRFTTGSKLREKYEKQQQR